MRKSSYLKNYKHERIFNSNRNHSRNSSFASISIIAVVQLKIIYLYTNNYPYLTCGLPTYSMGATNNKIEK